MIRKNTKTGFVKFAVGLGALIVAGVGILIFFSLFSSDAREQRAVENYWAELERLEKEDTYGGETPEETLALFVDALEAGNIELASRYFVVEEQERWLEKLKSIKSEDLNDFLVDVKNASLIRKENDFARFEYKRDFKGGVVNLQESEFEIEGGEINQPIDLALSSNEIWKIIDM